MRSSSLLVHRPISRALALLTGAVCVLAIATVSVSDAPAAAAVSVDAPVADALPAPGAIITVNASYRYVDETIGWLRSDGAEPKCSLTEAVRAANDNVAVVGCAAGSATGTDVIIVTKDQPVSGGIVTSDTRVVGNGHKLSTGSERAFEVQGDGASLTVENVVIDGASPQGGGGGPDDDGSVRGGAIYAGAGTTLVVDRSILRNNRAIGGPHGGSGEFPGSTPCGGPVWGGACGGKAADGLPGGDAMGGAIAGQDADVTVLRSVLSKNSVVGHDGASHDGGDGTDGQTGTCSSFGSLPDNHPAGDGGDGGDGGAGGDGGDAIGAAVAIDGGSLHISQTSITGNTMTAGEGAAAGSGGDGGDGGAAGTCDNGGNDGSDGSDGVGDGVDGVVFGAVAVLGDGEAVIETATIADNSGTVTTPATGSEIATGVALEGGEGSLAVDSSTIIGNTLTLGISESKQPTPTLSGAVSFISSIADDGSVVDSDGSSVTLTCDGRPLIDQRANVFGGTLTGCGTSEQDAAVEFVASEYGELTDATTSYVLPGGKTSVIVPETGSAALSRGVCFNYSEDQRGTVRFATCDAGAYEVGGRFSNTAPILAMQPADMLQVPVLSTAKIDLSAVFTDLETPNELTYTAELTDAAPGLPLATWSVSGSTLSLHVNDVSSWSWVQVTATDPDGLSTSSEWFGLSTVYTTAQQASRTVAGDEYTIPAVASGYAVDAAAGVFANDTHVAIQHPYVSRHDDVTHGTLDFDESYGGFTYTPEAGFTGDDSFSYGFTTHCGELICIHQAEVTLHVVRPSAVDDEVTGITAGHLYDSGSFSVLDNDSPSEGLDGEVLTARLTAQTSKGTVTLADDGTFTFLPDDGFTGHTQVFYKVSNQWGASSGRGILSLYVDAQAAPRAVDDAYFLDEDGSVVRDAGGGVLINDTDAEGDALTLTLIDEPEHGTVDLDSDGSFTYQADASFDVVDSFTYTASDGTADSERASVTIRAIPSAVDDAYDVEHNRETAVAASDGVLANDRIAMHPGVTATVSDDVQHGELEFAADGSFTYMPDDEYLGSDWFSYVVEDGAVSSSIAVVRLQVVEASGNAAPVAVADTYDSWQGAVLDVPAASGALASDTDSDSDALTVSTWGDPAHGTVTGSADGAFRYTPDDPVFVGDDSFEYTVSDGYRTAKGVVTIHLLAGPAAAADEYTVTIGDAELVTDAAAGVIVNDAQTTGVTAKLENDAGHGTVALASDGSFVYTPDQGFHGVDRFDYHLVITANGGRGAAATVTVMVPRADNSIPTALNDTFALELGDALSRAADEGLLSNDTDADGDVIAVDGYTATTVEGGTVVVDSDGAFRYLPPVDFVGTDKFTYAITDGTQSSGKALVSFVITDPNEVVPPPATDDGDGGSDGGSDSGTGGRSDSDGDGGGDSGSDGGNDTGERGMGDADDPTSVTRSQLTPMAVEVTPAPSPAPTPEPSPTATTAEEPGSDWSADANGSGADTALTDAETASPINVGALIGVGIGVLLLLLLIALLLAWRRRRSA